MLFSDVGLHPSVFAKKRKTKQKTILGEREREKKMSHLEDPKEHEQYRTRHIDTAQVVGTRVHHRHEWVYADLACCLWVMGVFLIAALVLGILGTIAFANQQ